MFVAIPVPYGCKMCLGENYSKVTQQHYQDKKGPFHGI
jgi:hypothetical protein